MEVASSNNAEFAFKIHTDVNKLYTLTTSPFNCFKLKNSTKIGQTIFMVAALQSLDSNYFSKFEILPNNKIASFSPRTSRFKTAAIHPPELLQSSSVLGAPFRKYGQRGWTFGVWVKIIAEKRQPFVETIVRQFGLSETMETR